MTPPYPPQQPGWPPQQGQPPAPGWNQGPPGYPNQPAQHWQQSPYGQPAVRPARSATPIIAGILAILAGLVYASYEFVIPATIAGVVFTTVPTLVAIVGGVLLVIRKRIGVSLAMAGGISLLYFALYVTVDALVDMDFDDGGYFAIPLLLIIIALLIIVTLPQTRLGCTSWEGRNFAAPPAPPTLPAVGALAIGAILLIVTVVCLIYGAFNPDIISAIVGILLLIGGGALLMKRNVAGQILTAFGAGVFIGPNSVNILYEVFGLSTVLFMVILSVKLILGIGLAVLVGMPNIDRAIMLKPQPAQGNFPAYPAQPGWNQGTQPGQYPPGWSQGAQPGQYPPTQQPPQPGWPPQQPGPPQR